MYNKYKSDYLCRNCDVVKEDKYKNIEFLNDSDKKILVDIGLPSRTDPGVSFGVPEKLDDDFINKLEEMYGMTTIVGEIEDRSGRNILIIIVNGEVRLFNKNESYNEAVDNIEKFGTYIHANNSLDSFAETIYEYNRFLEEMINKYKTLLIERFISEDDVDELRDRIDRIESIEKNSYWDNVLNDFSINFKSKNKYNNLNEKKLLDYNKFVKNKKELKKYRDGKISSIFKYNKSGELEYYKTNTVANYKGHSMEVWVEHYITYEFNEAGKKIYEEDKIFVGEDKENKYKTVKYSYDEKGRVISKDFYETLNDRGHYEYYYVYEDYESGTMKKKTVYYKDKTEEYIDISFEYDEKGNMIVRNFYNHRKEGERVINEMIHTFNFKYYENGHLLEKTLDGDKIYTYEYEQKDDTIIQYITFEGDKKIFEVLRLDEQGNVIESRDADGVLICECSYWD